MNTVGGTTQRLADSLAGAPPATAVAPSERAMSTYHSTLAYWSWEIERADVGALVERVADAQFADPPDDLGDDRLALAVGEFAQAYADQNEHDYAALMGAIARVGSPLSLGV